MPVSAVAFDLAVLIGRFQPPHLGHVQLVRAALARAGHVLVVCGSVEQPRSIRNPWSFAERSEMLRNALDATERRRVSIAAVRDVRYDDARWAPTVMARAAAIAATLATPAESPRVALATGEARIDYAHRFAGWTPLPFAATSTLRGTDIRATLFSRPPPEALAAIAGKVPANVLADLRAFTRTADYATLRREAQFVVDYRTAWATAPFPPVFVTVDAVVVHAGHVLLVRRGRSPGRGLMALPGGFIDPGERLHEAVLRELREETAIGVSDADLAAAMARREVFDDPHRSARGRIITHAYLFQIAPAANRPAVRGGDDADEARWVAVGDLDPSVMFEDHFAILQILLGIG